MNQIKIFDTTLRDGEQSPGCSMNLKEKIEVAKCLERLKVDVIEAGFAISSPGDFESVMTIALRSGNDGEVSRWLSRKRVTFPVVNDSGGEISRNWEISVTPTLVVVSKGQVVTTTSGWTSYWGMKLRLWRAAMF